jgi:hypothetical protein
MIQVLSLEEQPGPSGVLTETLRLVQRGRAARVVPLKSVESVEEGLVGPGLLVGGGDLFDDRHERFGNEPPTIGAEVALRIGIVCRWFGNGCAGTRQLGAYEIAHYLSARVSGRTDVCLR